MARSSSEIWNNLKVSTPNQTIKCTDYNTIKQNITHPSYRYQLLHVSAPRSIFRQFITKKGLSFNLQDLVFQELVKIIQHIIKQI